jgi:hypothetical protein
LGVNVIFLLVVEAVREDIEPSSAATVVRYGSCVTIDYAVAGKNPPLVQLPIVLRWLAYRE